MGISTARPKAGPKADMDHSQMLTPDLLPLVVLLVVAEAVVALYSDRVGRDWLTWVVVGLLLSPLLALVALLLLPPKERRP